MTYQISTTQELDALPHMAVVLTHLDTAVQINRNARPDPEWWHWVVDGGPATVLWEPAK